LPAVPGIATRLRNALSGGDGAVGRSPAPFVVGAPRSGTTMLRLMLDAHPELAIPPETYFITKAQKQWRAAKRRPGENQVETFIESVTGHKRWPDFHLDADDFARRVRERNPRKLGDGIRVFYEMYAEKIGKPRWGDKTPFYVRKMDVIHRALPEARFVHLIRDGRAVALSIKDLWFGPDTIEGCAEFWVARLDEAREKAQDLPHYLEIIYEDLVRDPEPNLRKIAEFIKVPFDERMVRFYENVDERIALETPPEEVAPDGRIVSTEERMKIMENLKRAPDPSRIDRWRTEMSAEDRATFEAIAGDRLRELGYPVG
jgi:Sulfotransferase family